MTPHALLSLIARRCPPSPAALASLARGVTRHAPLAPFPSLPGGAPRHFERWEIRHPALVRQHWQVLLMRWPPGYRTAIHDHGGAFGVEILLEGTLVVESFMEGTPGPVVAGTVILKSGHVETVGAQNHFHRCTNPAPRPALSLHVYSHPLVSCRAWQERGLQDKENQDKENPEGMPDTPESRSAMALTRVHPGLSGVLRI